MRYLSKPEPVTINEKPYLWETFLSEFVWSDLRWRDEWADDFCAIVAKLAKPVADLTDAEHEKLATVAKAAQFPPPLSATLMPLCHAITRAPREAPKE